MALSLSTVAQFAVPVSAQEFKQPDVVDIFDTIYGYERVAQKQTNGEYPELPAGLRCGDNLYYRCHGFGSAVADDGSNYVRISNDVTGSYANPEWVFDEVIRKGKLTISYDMYYAWDAEKPSEDFPFIYMDVINGSVNDNPTDKWTADLQYQGHHQLFTINESTSDGGVKVMETAPIADTIANRWCKITVVCDIDNGTSTLYIDGEEFGSRGISGGIKMISWQVGARNANAVGEVLFDNIYVSHTQQEISEISAGADFKIGGVDLEGGKVIMGLSENLELFKEDFYFEDDFVVKNSKGEAVPGAIKNIDVAKDGKAEIVFTLEELPKGTYTIGLSEDTKNGEYADYFKGVMTGKFPEDITFFTKGDVQNKENVRRYYINEDFEDYNGGHPKDALQTSIYNVNNASNMVAVENDNGTNFAFKNPDRAIFRFDQPIMGGQIFVEFDVKANGDDVKDGRWDLSLIGEREFLPDNYVTSDYWEVYSGRKQSGTYVVDTPRLSNDVAQYEYFAAQQNAAWNAAKAADGSLDETTFKTDWLNNEWPKLWESMRAANTGGCE